MKIALLTSGGVAPCLSAAIGKLVEIYFDKYPNIEIIGYNDKIIKLDLSLIRVNKTILILIRSLIQKKILSKHHVYNLFG